jgi:hypothetical protein
MTIEGPPLESLTRRLAETPPDFLSEPRHSGRGAVEVGAVVSDLLRDLGGAPLTPEQAQPFMQPPQALVRRRLGMILLACWLLGDPWFQQQQKFAGETLALLTRGLNEMARLIPPANLISDADRREELARFCLKQLGLRPAGESEAQADDRLTTLSSAERQRIVKAARAAEERAQKIREEIAPKRAADEADAKAIRE